MTHVSLVPTANPDHAGAERGRARGARKLVALALAPLALAACGGAPESAAPEPADSGGAALSGYPSSCTASTVNGVALTTCDIAPHSTSAAISALNPASHDFHHVVFPSSSSARSKNVLVVFLGGSESWPSAYQTISAEAASKGYGVLDLRYHDTPEVSSACPGNDACFSDLRGMTLFGEGTTVLGVAGSPYHHDNSVTAADSVVNRVVNLLDTLATYDAWWGQFLADTPSPYVSAHHAHVLPAWSKTVLAGHSQGGGHAAFAAMQLAAVRRVIMFSTPQDHVGSKSASWITYPQSGPSLPRFWGMRDTEEGLFYGACTSYNWHNLGGAQGKTCTVGDNAPHAWELFVGQGKGATMATGQHFLVTTDQPNPKTDLYAHDSTAVDDNPVDGSSGQPFSTDRVKAWDYLFTANGTD